MRRKHKGKQQHQKKQNRTYRKGITQVSLLTAVAIVIVTLIVGFLLFQNRPSHYSKLVSNPIPTASVTEKSNRIGAVTNSKTPKPKTNEIAVWLEIPTQARAGQTVPIILKVKNTSDRVKGWHLDGCSHNVGWDSLVHGFIVTRQDGTEIWSWNRPDKPRRCNLDIATLKILQSGSEFEIQMQWQQMDNTGNRVPPGTYFIHGSVSGWETELKALTIMP